MDAYSFIYASLLNTLSGRSEILPWLISALLFDFPAILPAEKNRDFPLDRFA
jgi:hypothetical protein